MKAIHLLQAVQRQNQLEDGVGQDELGQQDRDEHPFARAEKPARPAVVRGRHVQMLDGPGAGEDGCRACLDDAQRVSGAVKILPVSWGQVWT